VKKPNSGCRRSGCWVVVVVGGRPVTVVVVGVGSVVVVFPVPASAVFAAVWLLSPLSSSLYATMMVVVGPFRRRWVLGWCCWP
jgi:hypothetical protein